MTLFFEDFAVGQTMRYGDMPVSEADIVAFASMFDAQDFHVDPEKAKSTFVGGLIGSGWHTSALMMRMMAEGFVKDSAGLGAPGIDEVKWKQPLRPGDRLSVRHTVLEAKESRSKPDIGLVRFAFDVINQHDEIIQSAVNWIIFGRRGRVDAPAFMAPAEHPARYAPPAEIGAFTPPVEPTQPIARFDAVPVGEATPLGSFQFTSPDIKAFARAFDPQRFHIDEASAKASLFGGLCASGWHTGAGWMMLMVKHRRRVQALMGDAMPRLGSSPGFKALKWLKPVFAGDTISYSTTVTDKRASASRPDWGLVFHRNAGVNQHGETVFQFDGCVFWER